MKATAFTSTRKMELSIALLIFVGLQLTSLQVRADSTVLTQSTVFTSSSKIESSTATVNIKAGQLQVPLQVDGWQDTGSTFSTNFSVGDGHHGSFNPSTYLNFDNGTYANDQVIHINTDTYPDLQFTDFTLAAGWTIRPVGSKSLIIRSLSTLTIAAGAEINCDGEGGVAMTNSLGTVAAGGAAHCGGLQGGSGGSTSTAATAGAGPAAWPSLAGQAGSGASVGGGGGAGMSNASNTADRGRNSSGSVSSVAGVSWVDNQFQYNVGGGGGAGGTVGSTSNGAGGGAGGGTIYLYSVGDLTVAGSVHANGGAGGSGASGNDGGAGGGGAGGGIVTFSAANLVISGTVSAVGGAAGISGAGGTTSVGGKGADGRSWITDSDGMPTGGGSVNPGSLLLQTGTIDAQIGTFETISQQIDLDVSRANFVSASANGTSGAGNITLEVAVSDTPFASSAASWQPSSGLSALNGHRYLRYRLRLITTSSASAPVVGSVVFQYTAQDQQKFDFASCQLVKGGPPTGGSGRLILLLLFILPMLVWSKVRLPANS